ncbi:hypothetical protein ACIOHS_34630 [Streptomyces sp. NPDC088253]|uniref:hypothetical protein n=1 Tax=Streptomyces sp. NPDC088253 TaxID=3365846 RepID=UPI0037F877E7
MAPPTRFAELAQVLVWATDATPMLAAIEARYIECLSACLGRRLGELYGLDHALADRLRAELDATSEADLVRALLMPATSRRLATQLHGADEAARHLLRVLPHPQEPDARDGFLGRILGTVPVFTGRPGDMAGMDAVRIRIEELFVRAESRCQPILPFVSAVLRELHLEADDSRADFFSRSPQGLVGHAVLTNPHLGMVDEVMLIEAVVHEATHGFVGISEALGLSGTDTEARWLLDDGPYDGVSRVVSPWTGKALDIPTYLHACFVWWGLLHFWSDLVGSGLFDERRVRSRLLRAASGFRERALVRELLPYQNLLQPTLLTCLDEMGRQADEVLGTSGLGELVMARGDH